MGGSLRPIGDLMQMQKEKAAQQGAAYEAPAPANVYKQQQTPYQVSPFVQQQMQQMQRMQQMQQMQPEIRGLGQQDYVSPLQSMLNSVLYEYSPQQFNPQQFDLQSMMQQQPMPSYSGPAYRPDIAQVQQNLNRVSAPYIPPPPAPEPAPDTGGGGE